MASWTRAWIEGWHWLAATDAEAVQIFAEAVDDHALLRQEFVRTIAAQGEQAPGLWRMRKQVFEARLQVRLLGNDLGLSPTGRAELGVAEVRVADALAGLMERAPVGARPTITVE